jgi:hypothetical protein
MSSAALTLNYAPIEGSSNVKAVGYEKATRTLGVRFHSGSTYHYADVSPEKHASLIAADSVGSHLHKTIKGQHTATQVSD